MQTEYLPPKRFSHFQVNTMIWAGGFIVMTLCLCLAEGGEWIRMLDTLDKRMLLLFNFNGSTMTDRFWYGYTHLRVWLPLVGVVLVEIWRNSQEHRRGFVVFVVATALLVVVLDQTSSSVIKPLVGRLRPSHDPAISFMLHYVNGYHGGLYGFVSGHATNVVGMATWLGLCFRNLRTRIMFGMFAVLMCYSRIYLGVHYPGDVLCGALLGYCTARLAFHYLRPYVSTCTTSRCPYSIIIAYALGICLILVMP